MSMDNAGIFELAALQIGAARSASLLTPIIDLDGMSAVTLEAAFLWGSGGATVTAVVCTSFDRGTTWRQVARFDFATASATKTANLSGLTPKGVASYADLSAEGVSDGLLGDRLAVLLTSTGTYAGSVLSVRALVR
jgi:hypothetical protein